MKGHMETLPRDKSSASRVPKPILRVLMAGVFLIAFFALTSIIDPSQSTARDSLGPERGEMTGTVLGGGESNASERMLDALPRDATILGKLEGRRYTTIITAGELEPRYSVFSPDGETLVLEATLAELYELAPADLDIEGMLAGTGSMHGVDQGVPIDLDDLWLY
jgi:hypothetical protein